VEVEVLEDHIRAGISTEEVETLRRVLVAGAASGNAEDAALLARLSPLLDPRERAWDRVLRARANAEILTATVTEAVKGGVVVDLGIRGFVPSSQLGLNAPRNLTQFIGRTIRVRVLEVDRRRQTVVLTNRQLLEEERAEKRKQALGKLEEGQDREGVVRRLTDIGAFVDVGGVDGLLHVSEISWKRIERPADVLKVGQKVRVKVLRVDPGQGRISLSMRRLMADPWEEARKKYAVGTTVKVKIGKAVAMGAEVELDEGLDGIIPLSELAARRVNSAEEIVQPGQELDAVVIDLRPREHRIVFSLRKLEQKRDRQEVDNYQKKVRSTSERTTLGDLFGHLFEEYHRAGDEPGEAPVSASAGDGSESTEQAADAVVPAEEPVAAVAE
jgi:4-hydroxy-3-methylbut-2-enyl diphosphate reductase